MGCIYLEQNQFALASKLFEKAIALRPDRPGYRNNLAIAYFWLGKEQEAVQSLRKAILLESRDKEDRDTALVQKNLVLLTKYLSTQPRSTAKPILQYASRVLG